MSVSRARKSRGRSLDRVASRSKRQPEKVGLHSVKGLAFYDLDGTLVDLNLVHAALFLLANLGEWSGRLKYLVGFAARLPRLYMAERSDRRMLNAVLFESFKGVSRDRLENLGEEYCERVLLRHLYPHAWEMVEANRAAGLEAVLVTGSPDFIVAPLAERLNIQAFAANRLIFSGGLATGRLHAPVMAGEDKAEWCEAYAASRGLSLDSCWGYADSYYDLPFLAAVGHAVAVNPDRRLTAAARSRQWPIMSFAKRQTKVGRNGFEWRSFTSGMGGD
jgi:HAD superfamily hydrolase (TIGR01490 family)